jgi:hypothetical protein
MLRYNTAQILEWLEGYTPTQIAIEGLSFNAKSGSKDLIAANFWYLQMELERVYPGVPVHIFPVTTWRCPLFSKEENKIFTADRKLLKEFTAALKLIKDKKERTAFTIEHEDLILRTNVKWRTYNKLPVDLQAKFGIYGFTKGTFDLTDAYFISQYTFNKF